MFILMTYDIAGNEREDKKRLKKVAKTCESYGIRVQNSVFEFDIDNKQLIVLQNELKKIINPDDSVRFYKLGNDYKNHIEVIGKRNSLEIKDDNAFLF